MAKKSQWPAWKYGPNGESELFNAPTEVPEGWNDDVRRLNPEFIAMEQAGMAPDLRVKAGSKEWAAMLDMARRGGTEPKSGPKIEADGDNGPKPSPTPDPSTDDTPPAATTESTGDGENVTEEDRKKAIVEELRALGVNPVSESWHLETLEKKLAEAKANTKGTDQA